MFLIKILSDIMPGYLFNTGYDSALPNGKAPILCFIDKKVLNIGYFNVRDQLWSIYPLNVDIINGFSRGIAVVEPDHIVGLVFRGTNTLVRIDGMLHYTKEIPIQNNDSELFIIGSNGSNVYTYSPNNGIVCSTNVFDETTKEVVNIHPHALWVHYTRTDNIEVISATYINDVLHIAVIIDGVVYYNRTVYSVKLSNPVCVCFNDNILFFNGTNDSVTEGIKLRYYHRLALGNLENMPLPNDMDDIQHEQNMIETVIAPVDVEIVGAYYSPYDNLIYTVTDTGIIMEQSIG